MRSVDWRSLAQQRGTSPLFVRVNTAVFTLTCNYSAIIPPIFCCCVTRRLYTTPHRALLDHTTQPYSNLACAPPHTDRLVSLGTGRHGFWPGVSFMSFGVRGPQVALVFGRPILVRKWLAKMTQMACFPKVTKMTKKKCPVTLTTLPKDSRSLCVGAISDKSGGGGCGLVGTGRRFPKCHHARHFFASPATSAPCSSQPQPHTPGVSSSRPLAWFHLHIFLKKVSRGFCVGTEAPQKKALCSI